MVTNRFKKFKRPETIVMKFKDIEGTYYSKSEPEDGMITRIHSFKLTPEGDIVDIKIAKNVVKYDLKETCEKFNKEHPIEQGVNPDLDKVKAFLDAKNKEVYNRDVLIELCEKNIVDCNEWVDGSSCVHHKNVGTAWAYLKAGCNFEVVSVGHKAIQVEIVYRGFHDCALHKEASATVEILLYLN